MFKRLFLFCALLFFIAAAPALAEGEAMPQNGSSAKQNSLPSEDQIKKIMQEQISKSRDVFKRMDPDYKGLDMAPLTKQAVPSIPVPKQGTDIGAMVQQYNAAQTHKSKPKSPDLMVFVSFSMPKETLVRLVGQAGKAGAVLVLRGLKNDSLRESIAAIGAYEKTAGKASWQINPPAFAKFGVTAVPTFVLSKASQALEPATEGCAPAGSFVSVSGDVSLEYAIEKMKVVHPELARDAESFAVKLKGTK